LVVCDLGEASTNSHPEQEFFQGDGFMAALTFRIKLLIAAALTLASLILTSDASAVQKGTKASPTTILVRDLAAARHLLHMADHDYKGNRVKAIHEITKAMHALAPNHKHAKPGQKTVGNNIPQTVSDKHLQQALMQLQTIQSQLGSANTGNTTLANSHITNAINFLKTALTIN